VPPAIHEPSEPAEPVIAAIPAAPVEVAAENHEKVEAQGTPEPAAETKTSPAPAEIPAPVSPPTKPQTNVEPLDDDKGKLAAPATVKPGFGRPSPPKSMRVMMSRGTADLGGAKGAMGAPIKRAKPSGPLIAEVPRFKAPPSQKAPAPE